MSHKALVWRSSRQLFAALCAWGIAGCSVGGNDPNPSGVAPIEAGNVSVALGPVAGAGVTVSTLDDLPLGSGQTERFDSARDTETVSGRMRLRLPSAGRLVGKATFGQLDLSAVDDEDLVLLQASSGRDVDPDDDGLIETGEGADGPRLVGIAYAVARVSDLRSGTIVINPLSTLAYGAIRPGQDRSEVAALIGRLSTFLLKDVAGGGDLNRDQRIDLEDLYAFDPTLHDFSGASPVRTADASLRSAALIPLFLSTTASSFPSVAARLRTGGAAGAPVEIARTLFGDSDRDGLANVFEDPASHDTDGDGTLDSTDEDIDNDGVKNVDEARLGLIQWVADTDHDNLADSLEDFDADGLGNKDELVTRQTDPTKPDTDADGLTDKQEVTAGLDPKSPTDGATADSDSDTIRNGDEIRYGFAPKDPADAVLDKDGDTLTNKDEINIHHTDPLVADTDKDGIRDDREIANGLDPLSPTDGGSTDEDGDGLTNAAEVLNGLNPRNRQDADLDQDSDGLLARDEVTIHRTHPLRADTDSDGLRDKDELQLYRTDATKADTDADGLADGTEVTTFGTNPKIPDSDADGLKDGVEANGFLAFDRTTRIKTNPLAVDTDQDGIHDGMEKAVQDEFGGYVSARNAATFLLGALHPNNSAARPTLGGLSFTDPALGAIELERDHDGDGKPTIEELFFGKNPNNPSESFLYVFEGSGGTRLDKFRAMEEANFQYVPGGWDVDGDNQVDPGFFISIYEAKPTSSLVNNLGDLPALTQGARVYNPGTARFADRLCNNSGGATGSDADTADSAGACRGNRYRLENLGPRLTGTLQRATFTPSGVPYVGRTWLEARLILRESAVRFADAPATSYAIDLPTEKQWIQVARTIAGNRQNWASGTTGLGTLFKGHSDNEPSLPLAANDVSNPYDGTANSPTASPEQRRTLVVANCIAARDFGVPKGYSFQVWDFSGNVAEWTGGLFAAKGSTSAPPGRAGGNRFINGLSELEDYSGTNISGPTGSIATMPSWWKPSLTTGAVLSAASGVGAYHDGSSQSDINGDGLSDGGFTNLDYGYGQGDFVDGFVAVLRGGHLASALAAGAFSADLQNGLGRTLPTIGFRAAAPLD